MLLEMLLEVLLLAELLELFCCCWCSAVDGSLLMVLLAV